MKCRIVYKPDKAIVIIYPAPKSKRLDETEEQWLERVFSKRSTRPDLNGLSYDDIDISELPQNWQDGDVWEGEKGVGVWLSPEKTKEAKDAKELKEKIQEKIRELAIESLQAEGEL